MPAGPAGTPARSPAPSPLIITLAAVTPEARAGEFQVAACQADPLGFSTRAFEDFATRGMKIRRACNPEGRACAG